MLTFEHDILINQWVQGVVATEQLLHWYDSLDAPHQAELRTHVGSLCTQARATSDEGLAAVRASGIKPGRSACMLLSQGFDASMRSRLVSLNGIDGRDAYLLFLHLLRIADTRRRASEGPGPCRRHWWHRDLRDPHVVAELRRLYTSGNL